MSGTELIKEYESRLLKTIKNAAKGKHILDGYYYADMLTLYMYREQTRTEKLYLTEIELSLEQLMEDTDIEDAFEERVAGYICWLIHKSGAKTDPFGTIVDGFLPFGADGADMVSSSMGNGDLELVEQSVSVDLDDLIYDIPDEGDDDLRIEREELFAALLPEYIANEEYKD